MIRRESISLALCALLCAQLVLPAALSSAELERRFMRCCVEVSPQRQQTLEAATAGRVATATKERKGGLRAQRQLLLSAAWTLGMGALAYWSKERADSAYRRYMHSANTLSQQRYFERAERYDRIAGTAFVGMEVGVLFTSYLLFFRR